MSEQERIARHYLTGQPVRVRWEEGRFTQWRVEPDAEGVSEWIAPPLMDLQVNGFAGVDFQEDEIGLPELLRAARGLHACGCGRFLPTLITAPWEVLIRRLGRLVILRGQNEALRGSIAGWHIEGPFLSDQPGFHGAHAPEWMVDPRPDDIRQIRSVTGGDPVLITLAPERHGAIESIALARSLGMKVSLGHTDASLSVMAEAVSAGATGFTHLGNGCPQRLDRHDNLLWRVLDQERLTVSLIPDGIHVSPSLFRLVHRALGKGRIFYVSDAMAGAGAAPGRYRLGRLELEVGPDQVVRQPGQSNFAGSALKPCDGVFRAARMLRCRWQDVWDGFSRRPAEFMGLPFRWVAGEPADFCLIRQDPKGEGSEVECYLDGRRVAAPPRWEQGGS